MTKEKELETKVLSSVEQELATKEEELKDKVKEGMNEELASKVRELEEKDEKLINLERELEEKRCLPSSPLLVASDSFLCDSLKVAAGGQRYRDQGTPQNSQ